MCPVDHIRQPSPRTPPPTAAPIIRAASADEVDAALALLLAEPGAGCPPEHIRDFRQLARAQHYDLNRLQVVLWRGHLVHAAFFSVMPGRSAMIMTSAPAPGPLAADAVAAVAAAGLERLAEQAWAADADMLQVLIDPADEGRCRLCLDAGFRCLTDLAYLGFLLAPETLPIAPELPEKFSWLCYRPDRHDTFRATLARTYVGAQDCPELNELRTAQDALEGHRAAGDFDPDCWLLLVRDGEPVAALLLSPISRQRTLELTYMGVVPEARGRGLGRLLIRQALAVAARRLLPSLTLAVDVRNHFARRLYRGFQAVELLRRRVFLRARPRS